MRGEGGRAQLAYVTDLEATPSGGGAYGVNWNAFNELTKVFSVDYAGPIVPRQPLVLKTVSRIRRKLLGLPGAFVYFAPETLDNNAAAVGSYITNAHDAVVFRSATRWCRAALRVPYFVYLDAVFHTFFHNTFVATDFLSSDLERIWREEAFFLERSSGVFFESEWGMRMALDAYKLRGSHYYAIGRGGAIDPPPRDDWGGSMRLVTMAMNFRQKGGDIVLDAYKRLKPRYPSLTWSVLGAQPEGDWQSVAGITYEGMLSSDVPGELDRMRQILADAFLLLHPTREDTNPLVITEAAYFGCPAISVNRFAMPELIANGLSGVLLNSPVTASDLAQSISNLLDDRNTYAKMRIAARETSMSQSSWESIGSQMTQRISTALDRRQR